MARAMPLDTTPGVATSDIDDNAAATIRFKRPGRAFAIVLTTLCIIASFCCLIIYQVSASRYTVIGPVDPASGIRIEYTVSSRYAMAIVHGDPDDKLRKDYAFPALEFTPKPEPPLAAWVKTHIWRPAAEAESLDATLFTQSSSKNAEMYGWQVGKNGFVTVKESKLPMIFPIVLQDKRLVNGCPTTLVAEASHLGVNDHSFLSYYLLVRPERQSIIYIFETNGLEGSPPGPDLKEIENLRNTIRVVKTR